MDINSVKNFIVGIWIALAGVSPVSSSTLPIVTPSLVPTPSPIVEINPSDRALKIASYGWIHMTEDNKIKIKKDNGNENDDDNAAIRKWALRMDKDSVYLAKNEAKMQKMIEEANQPKVIYQTEAVSSGNNSRQIENDLDALKRAQNNRDFWETVCSGSNQNYNSLVGSGCK